MKIIGITGKSGSGKTYFARALAKKLNCEYIDIDKIGHKAIYEPEILEPLCERFGKGILDENGNVDRKKVGNIVFEDKKKMDELTELTWECMQQQLDTILLENKDIIVLEWMLLPISKYWDKCDLKILVNAKDSERKVRVLERDNISEKYFEKRDSASMDYSKYKFDYIFENDYNDETINRVVYEINDKIVRGDKR